MNQFILGVGSNLEPEQNIPKILQKLLNIFSEIVISRIIETEPVGLIDNAKPFLNLCIYIKTDFDRQQLKAQLNTIEIGLGRDRGDKYKKVKSRTADLDILLELTPDVAVDTASLPAELYLLPATIELLHHCGYSAAPSLHEDEFSIKTLTFHNELIGAEILTLRAN